MGLFRAARGIAEISNQTSTVSNARKRIFAVRDALRGTPQFSEIFYKLIPDPSHPPKQIVCNYENNSFWTIGWQNQYNTYEPFTTIKHQDVNIGYIESCAVFALFQECYPNVYEFPNRTITQIEQGVPNELNMKKAFIGKALKPAITPAPVQPVCAQPVRQTVAVPSETAQAAPAFCMNCGKKLSGAEKFCPGCGNRI